MTDTLLSLSLSPIYMDYAATSPLDPPILQAMMPLTEQGLIDFDQFQANIKPETRLVSIMWVNNETEVIQDIARLAEITRRAGTLATYQIIGMGAAFELAQQEMGSEIQRLERYRERFWSGISHLPHVFLNGHAR